MFRAALLAVFALCAVALGAFAVGCDNAVTQEIPDAQATPAGWSLVWADEFDGTEVDESKWEFQLGDGCPDLCGWGNAELQNYARDNSVVSDGTLKITALQNIVDGDTTYTSSRLRTLGKGDWTYGRFEVRAKLPLGQGMWPAIWLLFSEPTYGQWASSGEIDIMEAVGDKPDEVFGTLHYGGEFPQNVFKGDEFQLAAGTFQDDFFVFTVEWERVDREPGEDGEPVEGVDIRWFVNNVLYQVQTEEDWFSGGSDDPTSPFNHPFHMILNVAVGGNLPGAPDATTAFPQTMEVDYVRVYERTGS
ncbi:MAG: glycoside hydrolase family 16 protein [Bacteroidota bacterium]